MCSQGKRTGSLLIPLLLLLRARPLCSQTTYDGFILAGNDQTSFFAGFDPPILVDGSFSMQTAFPFPGAVTFDSTGAYLFVASSAWDTQTCYIAKIEMATYTVVEGTWVGHPLASCTTRSVLTDGLSRRATQIGGVQSMAYSKSTGSLFYSARLNHFAAPRLNQAHSLFPLPIFSSPYFQPMYRTGISAK